MVVIDFSSATLHSIKLHLVTPLVTLIPSRILYLPALYSYVFNTTAVVKYL